MRAEDEYKFEAENTEGSIYAGEPTSMPAFRKFLTKAEKKPILLPSWWNDEKRKECEQFGANNSEVNFSDLACCIEKHDIIEHYNDPLMPMQLRMFAEQVLERPLMGQGSATMLQMQMKREAGNIYGTHISL
jgi:splicing suppressor protein 51